MTRLIEKSVNIESDSSAIVPNESNHTGLATLSTYIKAATSDNTRQAYRLDIRHFIKWGGVLPSYSEQVIQYLQAYADKLNPRTLSRRLTAIKQWHQLQNFADPTAQALVKKTLIGITRVHGKAKQKAPPFTLADLERCVDYLNQRKGLKALRDKALLLVGFFGAFRANELLGIDKAHIITNQDGLIIHLPKSKTDQMREGQAVVLPHIEDPLCPVNALSAWLQESGIIEGPVFCKITKSEQINNNKPLNVDSLNPILKDLARCAGLENWQDISSHSMRRGLATLASKKGLPLQAIMRQGRWQDVKTVMGYIDDAQSSEDNVVKRLFV